MDILGIIRFVLAGFIQLVTFTFQYVFNVRFYIRNYFFDALNSLMRCSSLIRHTNSWPFLSVTI